jgi:hypothetical protein
VNGATVWDLALAELRMNLRSAGWRVLALVLAASSVIAVTVVRYVPFVIVRVAPAAQDATRTILETLAPILVPPLICGVALRERRLEMDDLYLSKPPSSEALLWGKFLGALASLLFLLFIAALAVIAAQPFLFRGEIAVLPVFFGALRAAPPLIFAASLAFSLAVFARTTMVAAIASALPIALTVAAPFTVPALRFTLTPYHLTYALLGLACVGAVAGWWESRREPGRRVPLSWIAGSAALVVAVAAGAISVRQWRGWGFDADPALVRLAERKANTKGPLPTAPLRTIDGGSTTLFRWQGKPIVIVFWSTRLAAGAAEVATLERAWREVSGGSATGGEKVGFVSVCVTDDPARARDLARTAGMRVPAVWNPPAQFGEAIGLAGMFGVEDGSRVVAGLVQHDGLFAKVTLPVSSGPQFGQERGPVPNRDWERRLYERALEAFRVLAEPVEEKGRDGAPGSAARAGEGRGGA